MACGHITQLEKIIDEMLKSGDIRTLDAVLLFDIDGRTPIKCSQKFLTKLDKLVSRGLDKKDFKSASLGLSVLHKCGKHLKLPGGQGLPGVIALGLLKKHMMQWFEKCRQLWVQCGPNWDETLLTLSEDLLDALMLVHESCVEGTYEITESFLYPVGQLAVDPQIYILIQKEAIRKFNVILDKIPVALKKKRKLLSSQEASDIMTKLASRILDGGDFDLQTALMEALCRMATSDQRKELADRWFRMEHVASAFVKIRDSDFETDCRKFLNLVNGMQGDRRRVYSYPCLEAYLDKYELLMPPDENLEEFWIDFNLGSHSISLYFCLADEETQEGQWETICITENEVQSYTITEKNKRHILHLNLLEVVAVGAVDGSSLIIHFSSSLDILHTVSSVYGHSKNKGFAGKTSISVAKNKVKIRMEETSSQVVPESQLSLGEKDKNTAHLPIPAPSASAQMMTPAKMRMSESSVVRSSTGRSVHGASSVSDVKQSSMSIKVRGKLSLEMVRSCNNSKDEVNQGELRMTTKTYSNGTIAGDMMEQNDIFNQNTSSIQASKKKLGKHKKNNPEAKPANIVPAEQGEEQLQDYNYIPDTQPRSERSTCSHWSKLSVSEMLMMSTQKINPLPKPEPCPRLSQQQGHQSSAQRTSIPIVSPISQKQLHSELNQRLQQFLNEKNQSLAPLDQASPHSNMLVITADTKDKSSTDTRAPREQQGQKNIMTKRKSKGQMLSDVLATVVKAPDKAPTIKSVEGRMPHNVKSGTKRAPSRKEKRDTELPGNMVKLISSRYVPTAKTASQNVRKSRNPSINRPIFDMSWLSAVNRDESGGETKFHRKTASSTKGQSEDVFAFKPVSPSSTGGKIKAFSNSSATLSSGIYDSSALFNSTKKGQLMAKEKRHVKKHLFNDTDTDYAMTDVSWLRESNRKTKPKVAKYSRQVGQVKPKAPLPNSSYLDLPPSPQKPVDKIQSNIKLAGKENERQPKRTAKPAAAPKTDHAASNRPKRAAVYTKSYKEQDTDDSQSEPQTSPVYKSSSSYYVENAGRTTEGTQATKKRTGTKQPTKSCMRLENSDQSSHSKPPPSKQKRPDVVVPETSKLKKRNDISAQKQRNALRESLATCRTSSCPSPPLIEKMRSAERSGQTLSFTCSPLLTPRGFALSATPDPPCQDTPSPILLLPKPCSPGSSGGNRPSSHSAEKKHKTRFIQSAPFLPSLTPVGQNPAGSSAAEISPVNQQQTSPPPSYLPSQPLLTSTLLEQSKPSMSSPCQAPFPDDTHNCRFGFSKVSTISQVSMSLSTQSSACSRFKDSNTASLDVKTQKIPFSNHDLNPAQLLISGPIRKRHISVSSDYEDKKKRSKIRGQRSPQMKPRKLFPSFAEVSAESVGSREVSSLHTLSTNSWEADPEKREMDTDEDFELPKNNLMPTNFCQPFSSELKEKFESRYKMTESYNKQSLKTVQQYTSSLNTHVSTYRAQRLEQLQKVLLQEISTLEQNGSVLKSMEKELTMYREKHCVAFCSYREQEHRRNETLTKAVQSNICQSVEYEEMLFTSQMCLIRKDMKSVQDKLLSQMQKEEIQSVKRGLHALFFP